ncbi:MAG: beta-glucosidase, partial [Solirubrobacteraceae bacterium]|nr:beta-glucosidase [Solirubrobacteraceae bacterium]
MKTRLRTLALVLAVMAATSVAAPAAKAPAQSSPQCPWMDTSLSPSQRAARLVAAMNLDQKIAMLYQAQPVWAHYGAAGYVPGQADLCIPDLVLNDAGQGVGDHEVNTTAFPAPIAQTSSWDAGLQRQFGQALG